MKPLRCIALIVITSFMFLNSCAELSEFAQSAAGERALSENEVINGLKEALEIGSSRASADASQTGGFLDNSSLFIAFPPEAQRVERTLRDLGFNSLVDDFIRTLNRSAEQAAAEAAPVFRAAITQMTIQDGFEILRGPDNAATDYFRRTTTDELHNLFSPVIEKALNNTAATRYWNDIVTQYNRIPFVQPVETNLVRYTTTHAADGLFLLLEDEEKAIRQDPIKRTTDLLRRVFGHSSLSS